MKFENWTPPEVMGDCQRTNECNSYGLPQKKNSKAYDRPPDKLHPEDQKFTISNGHSHKELCIDDHQHIQIQSSEKLNADDKPIKELGAHNQPPSKYNAEGQHPKEDDQPFDGQNAENYSPTELYSGQPLTTDDQQPFDPTADSHPPMEQKCNGQSPINLDHPPKKLVFYEKPPNELGTHNQPPEDSELPNDTDSLKPKELTASGQLRDGLQKEMHVS